MNDLDLAHRARQAAVEIMRGARRVCAEYARLLMMWWDKHKATYGVFTSEPAAEPLGSAEETERWAEAYLKDARFEGKVRAGSECQYREEA